MEKTEPRYTISVAAELAGVHPQTLRDYERKGLLRPGRTSGNTRLYSDEDLAQVRHIQKLIGEGVNLSGVEKIVALEGNLDNLQGRYDRLVDELDGIHRRAHVAAAGERSRSGSRSEDAP